MTLLPDREVMEDEETYGEWSASQYRCHVCWKDHREASFADVVGLSTHHLVKRSRRLCHLPWNLLRCCMICHELAEGAYMPDPAAPGLYLPRLTFAICLGVKRELDAGEWRADLLEELYGARLPEIEPLPDYFVRQRERREPITPWRLLNGKGNPAKT